VTITHPDAVINPSAEADGLFNLAITDAGTDSIETFENISSLPDHARYAPTLVEQQSKLVRIDGPLTAVPRPTEVTAAVFDPTGHDGGPITDADLSTGVDMEAKREGIWALEKADLFNLLCIPPYELDAGNIGAPTRRAAAAYCLNRRAIFIADPLRAWKEPSDISDPLTGLKGGDWGLSRNANSTVYFPRVIQPDPLQEGRLAELASCGAIAGIISRTDANRGIWKAPAGLDAKLEGVSALSVKLTNGNNDLLNTLAVNCLRAFPAKGFVVWGARTLVGTGQLASEWKYLPVRRTALYIEESLFRGTQWAVFEPNDEPLWAQIRLSVGSFMHNMFRQGAFQGTSAREAFFVKCDSETTTHTDINNRIVNIFVGFAPLKPAEFVVIKLQQIIGQA
jgi:phage tail sheath protein FI